MKTDSLKVTIVDSANTVNIRVKESNNYIVKSWLERGESGKSAYEIALDEGFTGTKEQWLESLKGSSAYELALNNGFIGTEEDWLNSLKQVGITIRPEDEGKVLTNNGSQLIWSSVTNFLSESPNDIVWDLGEI